AVDLLDHRQEQVVLARVVVVEHPEVGAGLARDRAQRGAVDAVGQKTGPGGVEDAGLEIGSTAARHRGRLPAPPPSLFPKPTALSSTGAPRIPASAPSSLDPPASPLPLSTIPRTIRRKCVSGSPCDSHWAGRGMPSNGNMKPLSKTLGRKMKNDICIACCWVR